MHNELPDSIEDLLNAPSRPSTTTDLRRRVLEQTCGILKRRRRLQRFKRICGGMACFAAGAAAMWLLYPIPPTPAPIIQHSTTVVMMRDPAPAPVETITFAAAPMALDLEWRAFDAPTDRAKLYFQAGHAYVENQDLDGAIRCYHQGLDAASDDERNFLPTDDWLLAILKTDRKDNRHAFARN